MRQRRLEAGLGRGGRGRPARHEHGQLQPRCRCARLPANRVQGGRAGQRVGVRDGTLHGQPAPAVPLVQAAPQPSGKRITVPSLHACHSPAHPQRRNKLHSDLHGHRLVCGAMQDQYRRQAAGHRCAQLAARVGPSGARGGLMWGPGQRRHVDGGRTPQQAAGPGVAGTGASCSRPAPTQQLQTAPRQPVRTSALHLVRGRPLPQNWFAPPICAAPCAPDSRTQPPASPPQQCTHRIW